MHRLLRSSSVRAVQRPAFAGRRLHSSGDRVAEASTLGADDTKQQSLGIYKGDKDADIAQLVENFTAPSLAKALRDREETLQLCAYLLQKEDIGGLQRLLSPYLKENIEKKRRKLRPVLDLSGGFTKTGLAKIQRLLHRQPREVEQSARRRASVVIPLCNVNGVASVLFERRSALVRTHKHEVCFPGGMVDMDDPNIIYTSVREMEEELGISANVPDVLGILRCNWSAVSALTGVSVTPVVGYIGRLEDLTLSINYDEVEQVFTVPVSDLLNRDMWQDNAVGPPSFHGAPFLIWGLTAYIMDRFTKEILGQCDIPTRPQRPRRT